MVPPIDCTVSCGTLASVRGALSWATAELGRGGVESSRRVAEDLLAHSLEIERGRLYLEDDRCLSSGESAAIRYLVAERRSGRPTAYIMGRVGFYNLILNIDRRALIPRPETELLIDRALIRLNESAHRRSRVVDIGCGCGNIALALTREYPDAVVMASDISPVALDLARANARILGMDGRVSFREGDLFEPWSEFREGGFDLILANPPYLNDREWARTPPEVRMYEPAVALQGGLDGLDVIRRIVQETPRYLKPGGHLIFEIGAGQGEAVRELLEANKGLTFSRITRDYGGRDRVVEADK